MRMKIDRRWRRRKKKQQIILRELEFIYYYVKCDNPHAYYNNNKNNGRSKLTINSKKQKKNMKKTEKEKLSLSSVIVRIEINLWSVKASTKTTKLPPAYFLPVRAQTRREKKNNNVLCVG